jgi:plasmid stabilization system protein ParE
MKKPLIIRPEAEFDLAEAYGWYETHVPGLGSQFLLSIDAALSSIQRTPELYPVIHKNVRRSLIRRFPYSVFYVAEQDRIVVLAVLHARRDPQSWKDRV